MRLRTCGGFFVATRKLAGCHPLFGTVNMIYLLHKMGKGGVLTDG